MAFHVLVFPPCFANSEKVDDFSPIPPRFLPDGEKIRYQERHGGRSLRTLAITRSLLWWILGPALLHMDKVRTRTGIAKNDTPAKVTYTLDKPNLPWHNTVNCDQKNRKMIFMRLFLRQREETVRRSSIDWCWRRCTSQCTVCNYV